MKNKTKLTILVGCSGSGKSTWAHKQWENNPLNTIIVNRDKIRELLFGYNESNVYKYYDKEDFYKMENEVTRFCDSAIQYGLSSNKQIIVDETHLRQKYINGYKIWNVPIEIKVFEAPLETLIERDSKRIRKVGVEVITKQYNKFKNLNLKELELKTILNDKTKTKCVVVDLDGTLAIKGNRNIFEWDKTDVDDLNEAVYNSIKDVENLIICTGRSEEARTSTLRWLEKYKINFRRIYFREKNDFRKDWKVKEEFWENICESFYIEKMLDDRDQVVRRGRALGFNVFQVNYGNF